MRRPDEGYRVEDVWGEARPFEGGAPWPQRQDSFLEPGVQSADVDEWVPSACVLCSNGCGLDIAVLAGRMVGVRGAVTDHLNRGRLGPKGLYGWQGQTRDRLTTPLIRGRDGRQREASWEQAMDEVVARSRSILEAHGPLSHGFYTSGQLMLEEYYTLAVIGKAGIGTPHMDGNTRLCTATAAMSLKETFGSDGQPGCYEDIDACDALFLFGHNVAETQTVLWRRILDRLGGPRPPALVCVDPRETSVAEHADIHLPVRPGTNLALLNGLLHEIIDRGWHDAGWVADHTWGFDELARVVERHPPDRVADICGVSADSIKAAAEVFASHSAIVSTVLQGVYQSHQATATACAVNNLHLLRGMVGREGATVLQMNGQPTAQNNRECGADGDLPGFRNWANIDHIRDLARLWDVDESVIPHWAPPTHAMQLFRYVEQGSVKFLWIAGTNPAVSMPDLSRIRSTLGGDRCFIVVNDGYHTETTRLADVVLPAALWGEKTGTFTNTDRTVHLARQAVDPPGQARSDLRIWIDYARRMDFRSDSGRPIPPWTDPEEAFDAWRECSRGRPCDYSGLSYDRLGRTSGIRWPCTDDQPDGTARLYTDGRFPSGSDECEIYGHDLDTGGTISRQEHRARRADGRARLTAVDYQPPPQELDGDYPLSLVTGRTVSQFHTRTKTGRVPVLDAAAPTAWVELSHQDANTLNIATGDVVRLSTRSGRLELPARVVDSRPGTVFVPFHYGEALSGSGQPANQLTLTAWDPVSKQPTFKVVGVRAERVIDGKKR
ncbi:putative molibdopterin-dependent oxidoreductase YjgC [Stackebrandtia endophytica]|uniref:Putative molibdopterin-dependent oxidoreductase YjgC n=1 Tax=Stackebrandtia endophytica TaxID=1496996 RepID=A0A543B1W8_9ACTN|nr:nitrate reductase [Stackebrandtia endophytica]TQL78823.1 putative molibdopterin-dependent oxidoreductase YjgC [Stackebrandtia endophytica]